ncbi:MAG: hypothetical protein HY536_02020 [Candidatus Colwellbacteria bacterium]|nr:hypothetical protein [Candidatus Colwellbacteria bacterium]
MKRIRSIILGAIVSLATSGIARAAGADPIQVGQDFNPLPQIQKITGVLNVPTTPVTVSTFEQLLTFLLNFKNWFFWGFFAFAIWQFLMVAVGFLRGSWEDEKEKSKLRGKLIGGIVGIVLALLALSFPTLIKSFLIGGGAVAQ